MCVCESLCIYMCVCECVHACVCVCVCVCVYVCMYVCANLIRVYCLFYLSSSLTQQFHYSLFLALPPPLFSARSKRKQEDSAEAMSTSMTTETVSLMYLKRSVISILLQIYLPSTDARELAEMSPSTYRADLAAKCLPPYR